MLSGFSYVCMQSKMCTAIKQCSEKLTSRACILNEAVCGCLIWKKGKACRYWHEEEKINTLDIQTVDLTFPSTKFNLFESERLVGGGRGRKS